MSGGVETGGATAGSGTLPAPGGARDDRVARDADWRDTLFVSDLDGTLLRSDQTISEASAAILNRLQSRGVRFTAASSRSIAGVDLLPLDVVRWDTPLLLMNGAIVYDYPKKRVLYSCELSETDTAAVTALCLAHGARPFVYTLQNDTQLVEYAGGACESQERFFCERAARLPAQFCRVDRYTPGARAVYYSIQGAYSWLDRIRQALAALPAVGCTLYADNYQEDNYYLEIFRADAGKGQGVRRLAQRLGVRRIVAFGDNRNDIPLLRLADTACVVENAAPDIQALADTVIAGNDADGVARYLQAVCG